MSWSDVIRLGVTLRPFLNPPPSGSVRSPFDSPLSATLEILERELRLLGATTIVLEVGYREQDFRVDGMPRANARMEHGAVALSFTSIWGPLRYVTNEFVRGYHRSSGDDWQHNLRAIALAMEALRKVDRYGVSKRGEQYTGWRALVQSTDPADSLVTAEQALDWLRDRFTDPGETIEVATLIRRAQRATHPDVGGDAGEFRRVQRAKELIEG